MRSWGILVGFQFLVDETLVENKKSVQDKDILIASGALNAKGQSNLDFYLFKHSYIKKFIQKTLPIINNNFLYKINSELIETQSYQLKPKEYFFKDGYTSNSSFYGLSRSALRFNCIARVAI